MNDWQTSKLGEIADIVMGQSPPSTSYNEEGIGLPFYQGVVDFSDRFVTPRVYCLDPKKIVDNSYVLISVRAPVGEVNLTKEKCCIGRGVAGIKIENADQDFLFYSLKYLSNLIQLTSSGTVFSSVTKSDLYNQEIQIPPLPEQKAIAGVLSALDDKIDLLHQQNATLEALAQTLFRQWFIEEAGSDWEILRFENAIETQSGYNHKIDELSDSGGLLLSMGSIVKEYGIDTSSIRRINSNNVNEKYLCVVGDIIISTRDVTQAAEVLGYPGIVPSFYSNSRIILGSNLYKIKIIDKKLTSSVLYQILKSDYFREFVKRVASGTSILMLKKASLMQFEISIPPEKKLREYEKIFSLIVEKLDNNYSGIRALERFRDFLLPKLMSGEVRVRYGQDH